MAWSKQAEEMTYYLTLFDKIARRETDRKSWPLGEILMASGSMNYEKEKINNMETDVLVFRSALSGNAGGNSLRVLNIGCLSPFDLWKYLGYLRVEWSDHFKRWLLKGEPDICYEHRHGRQELVSSIEWKVEDARQREAARALNPVLYDFSGDDSSLNSAFW